MTDTLLQPSADVGTAEPVRHRYEALDSWRGICALLVALMHADVLHRFWDAPLLRNGYLFVDYFFVLSGFVIAHAYAERLSTGAEAVRFMVRRFGRLWPLHATVIAAYIGIEVFKLVLTKGFGIQAGLGAFEPGSRADLSTLASQLVLTQGLGLHDGLTWNMPSWSISAEFWTYLVFALASLLAVAIRRRSGIQQSVVRPIIMLVLAMAAMAVLIVWSRYAMFATYDLGFARAIVGFSAGYVVWSLVRRQPCPSRQSAAAAPFSGADTGVEIAVMIAIVAFVSMAGTGPLSFAAPLVFAIAVFVFSRERGSLSMVLKTAPFQKLGLWSYGIYMVHDLIVYVMSLTISLLERVLGVPIWRDVTTIGDTSKRLAAFDQDAVTLAIVAVYLVAVVGLAALAYRFVEDPARRAFNRLSNRLT